MKKIHLAKTKRILRVRSKLVGTSQRPRLSVFRSLSHLQAQLIDDKSHVTLLGLTTQGMTSGTKTERAAALGTALAEAAVKKGITTVIFDRGSARYHGRVKALAEAARSGGLKF